MEEYNELALKIQKRSDEAAKTLELNKSITDQHCNMKVKKFMMEPRKIYNRDERDRKTDERRAPVELLAFLQLKPGMKVADIGAGTGYTTELLARAVGPEGTVYGQNPRFVLERFAEEPLSTRLARLEEAGRGNVERIDAELDEMQLPADLDAAVFIRFYHDLFWLPTPDGDKADRAEFLRLVHDALKPGGVFGVVDHHAEEGSGERDALDPRSRG